jgi:hypothetical protein
VLATLRADSLSHACMVIFPTRSFSVVIPMACWTGAEMSQNSNLTSSPVSGSLIPMVASERETSMENQAAAVLSVALAQLKELDRAFAVSHDSRLASARDQARGVVSQIRAAMESGTLTASSLAALAASINIGVDAAALAAESESAAIAAKVELASASFDSHATVSRMATDLFDKHEFDGDVARHTHGAELEAFKKHQAESEKYIRAQLARRTPDGDLNASGGMQGYMLDANAYGAGDNPAFRTKWDELKAKTDRLREAMRTAGRSTKEYDEHIGEYVKTFLKAKGLSEEQISQALAKSKNPVDAVEPYLSGDVESKKLANHIGLSASGQDSSVVAAVGNGPTEEKPLTINLDVMNARLAAAGLDAPTKEAEASGHGLSVSKQKSVGTIER